MTPHEAGLVVAAWRRHYSVLLDAGGTLECVLKGRRTVVACGDRVQVARIAGGGAIEKVEPRTSLLYRSDAFREKVLAANVTQVVGVVAPDIAVDENLLNRWIVAAELERCRFVLVANKADLPGFPALVARLAQYRSLGYPVVECEATRSAGPLAGIVAGERSVLIGQSGMGKSTILNALCPHARARIGDVSDALGSGRHTTTETALFMLPGRRRRLDRRLAGHEGVRHRARRSRDAAGGVRRDASAPRPLPLPRLPPRSRAGVRGARRRRRRPHRSATARPAARAAAGGRGRARQVQVTHRGTTVSNHVVRHRV